MFSGVIKIYHKAVALSTKKWKVISKMLFSVENVISKMLWQFTVLYAV